MDAGTSGMILPVMQHRISIPFCAVQRMKKLPNTVNQVFQMHPYTEQLTPKQKRLAKKHGNPVEFELACYKAVPAFISSQECYSAVEAYKEEWRRAGLDPLPVSIEPEEESRFNH